MLSMVGMSGEKNYGSNPAKYESSDNRAPTFSAINNQTCSPNQETANNDPPHWYTSPEWWLFILGVPTLVFIALQAREMRKATEAARDGAQAALKNANALICAERAWVQCRPSILAPNLVPLWGNGDLEPPRNPYIHLFPATVINVGKTPALLDEIVMAYKNISIDPFAIQEVPIYRFPEKCNGRILAPGDPLEMSVPLSGGGTLSRDEVSSIQTRESYLYAWGIIRYKDVHGESHETAFGYVYHFPQGGMVNVETKGFRVAGPSAYNRAT